MPFFLFLIKHRCGQNNPRISNQGFIAFAGFLKSLSLLEHFDLQIEKYANASA